MLEAMRIKKKFMKPLHLLFPLPGWFCPSSILSFLGLSSTSPLYHHHWGLSVTAILISSQSFSE